MIELHGFHVIYPRYDDLIMQELSKVSHKHDIEYWVVISGQLTRYAFHGPSRNDPPGDLERVKFYIDAYTLGWLRIEHHSEVLRKLFSHIRMMSTNETKQYFLKRFTQKALELVFGDESSAYETEEGLKRILKEVVMLVGRWYLEESQVSVQLHPALHNAALSWCLWGRTQQLTLSDYKFRTLVNQVISRSNADNSVRLQLFCYEREREEMLKNNITAGQESQQRARWWAN
ncbi:hypothetical protein PSACC_01851 [Paramicrosporidium saccamoebae]|uniref:Uncharacterized protein n=1 Tax=Paramicrosporidium saccamoebae TaxID=1246581 RepID=A0A2H9TKP9_9FUNG|nr:hypothetical protein PSACC_01851 [Paramicrosporidium saccamoebae]